VVADGLSDEIVMQTTIALGFEFVNRAPGAAPQSPNPAYRAL